MGRARVASPLRRTRLARVKRQRLADDAAPPVVKRALHNLQLSSRSESTRRPAASSPSAPCSWCPAGRCLSRTGLGSVCRPPSLTSPAQRAPARGGGVSATQVQREVFADAQLAPRGPSRHTLPSFSCATRPDRPRPLSGAAAAARAEQVLRARASLDKGTSDARREGCTRTGGCS